MKKNILSILFFITTSIFSNGFDYDTYKYYDSKKILEYAKTAQSYDGGFSLYMDKISFPIKLSSYPVEATQEQLSGLDLALSAYRVPETWMSKFGHITTFTYNGFKYNLVYQSQLIPYLRDEVELNQEFVIYALMGSVSFDGKKEIYIAVNEFSDKPLQRYIEKISCNDRYLNNIKWGTTIEEVMEKETNIFVDEYKNYNKNSLVFQGEYLDKPVYISYEFINNQLYNGAYTFQADNPDMYQEEYDQIETSLNEIISSEVKTYTSEMNPKSIKTGDIINIHLTREINSTLVFHYMYEYQGKVYHVVSFQYSKN